jgi:hypothetical protein
MNTETVFCCAIRPAIEAAPWVLGSAGVQVRGEPEQDADGSVAASRRFATPRMVIRWKRC